MKHFLFQQLILCVFFGIIPCALISFYISKNKEEIKKANNELNVATNNLIIAIKDSFCRPSNKTFYFIMGIALIMILLYPFN